MNPWINKETINIIKDRDKLCVKLEKTKCDTDGYAATKLNLNTLNNIIKSNIRQNKKEYYHQ